MVALAKQGESAEVQCVVIPMQESRLLLPNECVAEILPWRRIKPLQAMPSWCSGILGWRGETIPVPRYELINEHASVTPGDGRCLVVMNRAKVASSPAFYALAAQGLPRLLQLSSEDLIHNEPLVGPMDSAAVMLGTEMVQIPNLELIERQVLSLGINR